MGVTLWLPSGHPSFINDSLTSRHGYSRRLSSVCERPRNTLTLFNSHLALISCHDLGSLSSSCRKLQSLRALTAKAPSTPLQHQLSVWNKQSGSTERTKLCLSSLVMKRGLICRWGPLFSKLQKINLKQQPGVEQG